MQYSYYQKKLIIIAFVVLKKQAWPAARKI